MLRRLLALCGLALLGFGGTASAASPDVFVTFQTPSRKIGCGYDNQPDFLRCEIDSGLVPAPAKPRSCEFDVGNDVGMSPTGRARVLCVSDTVRNPAAPVLAYGATWRRAGFTCVSTAAALRCTNRSGHGFVLSRARSARF